ncbi:MAG: OmpA family protein [Bryobacteraceae bacterium]|nr:OmpA family protein [Solibacteraceae bacterium]MCL4843717.1 OmpA family protein [Bryobacteraceae bacterium]MCO5353363.1 OmpA family protein [Bryobacteraceae bacterium]
MKRQLLTFAAMAAMTAPAAPALPQAPSQGGEGAPIYRVRVTSRTAKAVNYRQGNTKIDFKGTAFMPFAKGEARIQNRDGRVALDVRLDKMEPASKFGPPFMTYVLWAITPEGNARNLGPLTLDRDRTRLQVTTNFQSFAMIVTAEPYYAVTVPSEMVVLENEVRQDTRGKVDLVDARYELFQRGYWEEGKFEPLAMDDPKAPFEYYEAQNAMRIARWAQADKYAPESYQKAEAQVKQADVYRGRKGNNTKPIQMVSREATQFAEDARVVALKRIEEERLANERAAAAKREADAKAARAAAEQRQREEEAARKQAELDRLQAEKAKAEADRQRMAAELESARSAAAQAEADRARAEALARERQASDAARRAQDAARDAEEAARQALAEKQALRASLLARFNQILETRDTERGLVVNMADVLFDVGKFDLRQEAREKLARFSGVVLAYPTLRIAVEGHTDSTGSDELNQRLSERRAESVRNYLVSQGLDAAMLTSQGFGKTMPIADNSTRDGRQQNRRVELIVSGEVIGTALTRQ